MKYSQKQAFELAKLLGLSTSNISIELDVVEKVIDAAMKEQRHAIIRLINDLPKEKDGRINPIELIEKIESIK